MKKVSVKSNAYNEWVGFVGTVKYTTFASEWDALDWLQEMTGKGHLISNNSDYSMLLVEKHAQNDR